MQRRAEWQGANPSTSIPNQCAVHDIAALFGHPMTAGDTSVQRKRSPVAISPNVTAAPEIAARGVVGAGAPLPHLARIQASFGHHDVSTVQAHQGPAATGSARELGAEAYAIGDSVAFSRSPDLHMAAHEAAHVVQQRGGVQLKGGIDQPGDDYERHADAVADVVVAGRSAAPLLDEVAGHASGRDAAVQRTPTSAAAGVDSSAQPGMWEHTFGEASTPVGKLGRVQAPKGTYLRERPLPDAPSPSAPVPFNGLVFVERRTDQSNVNERWCYVIATEAGIAGFCEERYLAIDPPEPTATLHRTAPGERLATIAEQAYGPAIDDNNSRLYVQALYLANHDRAGVQLDHVDLSFKDRALRGEDERRTLEVYKGAKVIAGASIWIPSKPFIEQLKAAGAVTGGSTLITEAWDAAKAGVGAVLDGAKYVAGFFVGLLEGAYNAIVDLFKGAVDMVEAVLKVVWNIVIGNPGRVKEMASAWVEKMKAVWEHRGEIADEFLKKWNAENAWDRGLFQGEVLGWVTMTVLLILVTMGENAPSALSGIAMRWPQLIKLLRTVDALGDVTTYLGAAAKLAKLPGTAARFVSGKFGRAERAAEHVAEDVGKGAGRAGHKLNDPHEHVSGESAAPGASKEHGPEHGGEGPSPASEFLKAFRRAKKIKEVEAVSLKRLRLVLGQAGMVPGKYKLARTTEKEFAALGGEASGIFGWVARDGAGNVLKDARGRPIITFTPLGLSSLEQAVKTFGHELRHLQDFAAGVLTSSEIVAEHAGNKLWVIVQESLKKR